MACTAWRGSLFTRRAARDDYLPQYASVFDAVEGNSTFYGLPTEATVVRWHEQVPRHFRFCFKFPQVITHRMLLRYADAETSEFLFLLEPLRDRLGPLLLQLPPNFGAADLHVLTHYLDGLPGGFPYAVEVRHPEFFDGGAFEAALDDALAERLVARVNFDATCLFADPGLDETTREMALLHWLDGMTQEEVAQQTGYSRKTVGVKLKDAETQLRVAFGGESS